MIPLLLSIAIKPSFPIYVNQYEKLQFLNEHIDCIGNAYTRVGRQGVWLFGNKEYFDAWD